MQILQEAGMQILQEQKSVSLREKARACPGLDPGMKGTENQILTAYFIPLYVYPRDRLESTPIRRGVIDRYPLDPRDRG
jgi:hypothetical protein